MSHLDTHADLIKDVAQYTQRHQLTVLHDAGAYKHLRYADPGTFAWSFEIITWPGHLVTAGDVAAGYTLSTTAEITDTTQPMIDPDFLIERTPREHRSQIRHYSPGAFFAFAHGKLREAIARGTIDAFDAEDIFTQIKKEMPVTEERAARVLNDRTELFGHRHFTPEDLRPLRVIDKSFLVAAILIPTVYQAYKSRR